MSIVIKENIMILCYINGSIIYGPNGIEYVGRPERTVRIKSEIRFEKLENKLCRLFRIDKSKNRLTIIYRYPQIVQLTLLKYEPVPITEDEDIKVIFSTVSSHPSLLGVELYLEMQPIETEQNNYKVIDRDIRTTQDIQQISLSRTAQDTEHVPETQSSRHAEDQFSLVDPDAVGVTIRESSVYTPVDDIVYIDNRLFEEDDIRSGDEMDFHPQEGGTSAPVDCVHVEKHPS